MSLNPVPGTQITPQGKLTPPWQSWFYQLFNFVTGAFSSSSVSASTTLKSGAVLVAALPSPISSGSGTRYFVTDATVTTFASIVAGGGANGVPVYSDGAAWRIG